jgi:hypothetical protein
MAVDFEKAEQKVEKASSFFTTLNAFIKKHPIWSAIIAIALLSEAGYLTWDATHEDDYYGDGYYEGDYYDYEADTAYYEQTEY